VEQQIRFCTAPDCVRLAYATFGQGPAIVKAAHWFTHVEFDWHSPVWRHWWDELGRDHRVVRYDERGCGLSDSDPQRLDHGTLVADLETVVDAARLGRFALLGVSQGGATAIRYAIRHPERVSHLLLCGAYARGRMRRPLSARQRAEEELLQSIVRDGWGAATPVFRRVFASLLAPDATEEQTAWLEQLMQVSTSPTMAARIRELWSDEHITAILDAVTTPTLVAHARDDRAVPFAEGRLLAAGIPGARLLPLDSYNHALLPTEPAWRVFVTELRAFLGSAPASHITPAEALSARELQVLELVAAGLSNEKIASRLYLSPRTVERHLSNIYAKLRVSGKAARAAAAAYLFHLDQTGESSSR
jgi:pimeloyl-ACP methyl ester carboxylesterase/DNA-binding CsgD family transcriptional regulator